MTPEQEDQFRKFGCACRCLLALAAANGDPQTKEEFIDAFSKEYPFWERIEQCGVTDTGMVLDIARRLKLANTFQILINKNEVRKCIKENRVRSVILFTEKKQEKDGSFSDYFHCSLVSLTAAKGWTLADSYSGRHPKDDSPAGDVRYAN
jgi:hypothetical protein